MSKTLCSRITLLFVLKGSLNTNVREHEGRHSRETEGNSQLPREFTVSLEKQSTKGVNADQPGVLGSSLKHCTVWL